MDQARSVARRGNPLRSGVSWQLVAIEAIVALGLGIYTLAENDGARRNIQFLTGVFLLVIGISNAVGGMRTDSSGGQPQQLRLLRAGIAIATGAIVVLNRFTDFMGIDAGRVVTGLGLLGVGAVSIWAVIAGREAGEMRIGAVLGALVLAAWGVVLLYQAASDSSSTDLLGWLTVVAGVALAALAYLRWRAQAPRQYHAAA